MFSVKKFGRGVTLQASSTAGIPVDAVRQYAPSVLAEQPHMSRGSRYSFVSSASLLSAMDNAGFVPMSITQTGARKQEDQGFKKHMIRFRSRDIVPSQNGFVPEVILTNSHDGTSSYWLDCGVFRFVCSNGLVVADALFESLRVRHSGRLDDVIDASYRVIEAAPKLTEKVDTMRGTMLTSDQRYEFAQKAAILRAGSDTVSQSHNLLQIRRKEDQQYDLWSTFNTVQENIIQGGIRLGLNTARAPRRMRAINGINDNLRLNKALWALAEETLTTLAV